MAIARNFILGKVYNSKWILERASRDYALRLDVEKIKKKSAFLAESLGKSENARLRKNCLVWREKLLLCIFLYLMN